MGKVSIDNLQAGMVLASDALSADSRVLLRAGMNVTEKHLRIFKAWGLIEVDVQGVTQQQLEAQSISRVDKEQLRAAQDEIRQLFCHNDTTFPPVAELLYICTLRKLEHLFQGRRHDD